MFGEFTVPASVHDVVYFDLIERGYIEVPTTEEYSYLPELEDVPQQLLNIVTLFKHKVRTTHETSTIQKYL